MSSNYKSYEPYFSPTDPCPPIKVKMYSTPPNLYMGFQPPNLQQYSPMEALKRGTLWQPFFDPYYSPYERARERSEL